VAENIALVGIYAAAIVKDFEAALDWYTTLMGRAPDDRPFPGMAQWRNMGAAGLQLWQDDERAGQAIMTIVVSDLEAEKARLTPAGFRFENEATGDFGAVAQIFDREGNRINLTQPPKGFVNR
jgi:predicted enzyme related to lactoylglutathione lyase